MPSLTLSTSGSDAVERCIPRFGRNVLVTLNGVATGWTPDSDTIPGTPVFQLAGGAGSRIARQQIYSATLATLWLDAGPSIATLTVTDPQNAALRRPDGRPHVRGADGRQARTPARKERPG